MNIHCVRNIAFFLLIPLFITACERKESAPPKELSVVDVQQAESPKTVISKYDELLAKAKSGDIEAQYQLAEMLNNADGVPENDAEAFKWYESAANGKHPEAILRLSNAYNMPDASEAWLSSYDNEPSFNLHLFVQQNQQKAIVMVEELAATGNQQAITSAWIMNLGKDMDAQKSMYWLKLGASQDYPMKSALAIEYVNGKNLTKDIVLARAWMHLHVKPKNRYQNMFGEETPEQISLAVELAEKWKPGYDLIRLPNGQYDAVPFVKIVDEKSATKAVAEAEVGAVNEIMMQSVRCHVNGDALLNTSTGNLITDTELVKYSPQGDDKGMCQVKIVPMGVHWEPCFYDSSGELYSNSDGRSIQKEEVLESRKVGNQNNAEWVGDCLLKNK